MISRPNSGIMTDEHDLRVPELEVIIILLLLFRFETGAYFLVSNENKLIDGHTVLILKDFNTNKFIEVKNLDKKLHFIPYPHK